MISSAAGLQTILPSAFRPVDDRGDEPQSPPKKRPRHSAKRMEQRRQSARRVRLKKKFELSRLQQEYDELRKESARLKRLIREHIPEQANEILGDCTTYKQTDFELLESLAATQQSYVITDPRLPDNPIVYASDAFCELTGFPRDQVEGRNCRFLQGPATDPAALETIRASLEKGVDCTTVLLNYKANGKPFWNKCFIAALRDCDNQIVNYVGVQCEQKAKDKEREEEDYYYRKLESLPPKKSALCLEPAPLDVKSSACGDADSAEKVDWSALAEAFEAHFRGDDETVYSEEASFRSMTASPESRAMTPAFEPDIPFSSNPLPETLVSDADTYMESLEWMAVSPLEFITRTVRSEVINSLLACQGDVRDRKFDSALTVLGSIYTSSGQSVSRTNLYNGTWRDISMPHYSGCLGTNNEGDFMYTLGKMSFDMFKPGKVVCAVKRTLNHIEKVCPLDGAPTAAPWSLRRELAEWGQSDEGGMSDSGNSQNIGKVLKSYNIAVDLTIEPPEKSSQKSPPRRLRALNVTQGYMLPDPETPNRLTVWFTGGRLAPAPPPPGTEQDIDDLEAWQVLFNDTSHKRTWDESFRVMGAKLFCGASPADGMGPDGTMKYTLHRPAGGHGKAFVDIVYLDDYMLVLKSSGGITHVMVKSAMVDSKKVLPGTHSPMNS